MKPVDDTLIIEKETTLRKWFTRDCDPVLKIIDGLDIGWGGIQRWITREITSLIQSPHLDFACGYGTFLAQLGWRFPQIDLVGLNIDFEGVHEIIHELLNQANVTVELVKADARDMPFPDNVFGSASCFLGLQDIEIGFGISGVNHAIAEAVRVLQNNGLLFLIDEYSFTQFDDLLANLPVEIIAKKEQALDIRWNAHIAERAIRLYAECWVAQARASDAKEQKKIYQKAYNHLKTEMKKQLKQQGYYIPFDVIKMMIAKKS